MKNKEAEAQKAYEHYSKQPNAAVAKVVNSNLSEKKIRRILKMTRTDKEVIEQVIEQVRRERAEIKK